MALNPLELVAERWYDTQRRRCRVQVYLNSPEEVLDWKRRAKAEGLPSVGSWIAITCRQTLCEREKEATALERCRHRAEAAEAECTHLQRRIALLERTMSGDLERT